MAMADPFDDESDVAKAVDAGLQAATPPLPTPTPLFLDEEATKRLNRVIFRDDRWERGLKQLEKEPGWGHVQARNLLQRGARTYGFWDLSVESLDGLVNQVLNSPDASEPSPGLQEWIMEQRGRDAEAAFEAEDASAAVGVVTTSASQSCITRRSEMSIELSRFTQRGVQVAPPSPSQISSVRFGALKPRKSNFATRPRPCAAKSDWKGHLLLNPDYLRIVKYGIHLLVFVASTGYAIDVVSNKYPDATKMFSWPIFFARLGGMACVLWTAILFLSMSRGLLSLLSWWIPKKGRNLWFTFLDSHKDIHIMSGKALAVYSCVHVLGHCVGTVPGMLQKTVNELNDFLGCSQDDPPYLMDLDLDFLSWPGCPLTDSNKPKNFTEALFLTMPGLTGVLLVLLLAVVGYTSRGALRARNFELFWYVHNAMLVAWPLLLFFHGSQGWIGVGIPLVLLVVTMPIITYSASRVRRLLRFYLFAGKRVKILRATVRPGKGGSIDGAITELEVRPPSRSFWRFRPGMYAFICMPEYARFQWHPFTITSGQDDATMNFIISAVGDWTQELARRCLAAAQGDDSLPIVALDGPFVAPTMSAMEKKVLVAVGAGVGITPFISLLSTFIAELPSEQGEHAQLIEVHFYWITRNPTEFIFGWRLLHKWLEDERLQAKIFIHLYITGKDPVNNDAAAFLFREAVKRQSAVDRKRFEEFMPEWQAASATCRPGPQFPWCWAEGQQADLVWVKCPNWDSADAGTNGFLRVKDAAFVPRCTSDSLLVKGTLSLHAQRMFPIVFGRPDFLHDIASLGLARPEANIHVYICGNDALVRDLQSVCQQCCEISRERSEREGKPRQKYMVHFERFG